MFYIHWEFREAFSAILVLSRIQSFSRDILSALVLLGCIALHVNAKDILDEHIYILLK